MRITSNSAAGDAASVGSDVVFHSPSSSISSKKKIAAVLMIAILAAIAVAVSIAASGDREFTVDPPVTRAEVQEQEQEAKTFQEQELKPVQVQEDTATQGPKAVDAPKPAPKPNPPEKEDKNANTMIPTGGMTTTVSTEISAPPTVAGRVDRRSMIQSPTWHV